MEIVFLFVELRTLKVCDGIRYLVDWLLIVGWLVCCCCCCKFVNHTFAECTMMILRSTVGSVDEDSLNRESFTMGLVDGNGDPVLCNLMEGNITNLAYHLCSLGECDR